MYRSSRRHSNSSKIETKLKKNEINFHDHFKTIGIILNNELHARPDQAWPWRSLTAYLSETIIDRDVKFWHNLHSSLQFCAIKIWNQNICANYALFGNVAFGNFQLFFYHDFQLKNKFQIMMVSSERSWSDLLGSIPFQILTNIFYT